MMRTDETWVCLSIGDPPLWRYSSWFSFTRKGDPPKRRAIWASSASHFPLRNVGRCCQLIVVPFSKERQGCSRPQSQGEGGVERMPRATQSVLPVSRGTGEEEAWSYRNYTPKARVAKTLAAMYHNLKSVPRPSQDLGMRKPNCWTG